MSLQYSPINNPFAILNLSGDSFGSKINTQVQRVLIEGKLKGGSEPTNLQLIQRASECLSDPVERFRHGFFWLTLTDDEESAFRSNSVLSNVGIEWSGAAEQEYDSIASASNLVLRNHNKAVLQLGLALSSQEEKLIDQKKLWLSAFRSWVLVIDSNTFWELMCERAGIIDDPRLNSGELSKWRASIPQRLIEYVKVKATSSLKDYKDKMALHWVNIIRESPFPNVAIDAALSTIYEPFTKSIELKLDNLEGQISGNVPNAQLKKSFSEFKSDVLPAIKQLVKLGDLPGLAEEHARDRAAKFLRMLSISFHNKDIERESVEANKMALTVVDSDSLKGKLAEEKDFLSSQQLLKSVDKKVENGNFEGAIDELNRLIRENENPQELTSLRKYKSELSNGYAIKLFNEATAAFKREADSYNFPSPSSAAVLTRVKRKLIKSQSYAITAEVKSGLREALQVVNEFLTVCSSSHFSTTGSSRQVGFMDNLGTKAKDSSCFVATATFGTADDTTVVYLRSYRDLVLEEYALGRAFIVTYWMVGPVLASVVRFIPITRLILKPLLKLITSCLINTKEYQKRSLLKKNDCSK